MIKFWRYAVVRVIAFVIGSATVVSANSVKEFIITSGDGLRVADVTDDGRLMVDTSGEVSVTNLPDVQQVKGDVTVENFPSVQNVAVGNFPSTQEVKVNNFPEPLPALPTIVNLIKDNLSDDLNPLCTTEGGLSYTVPSGKALYITDVLATNPVGIWTDGRGIIYRQAESAVDFDTPLVINSDETLCLFRWAGVTTYILVAGQLVDAP